MEQRENLLDVLKIFFKWLRPITYLCLGVGIGTAAISLLLSNYYKSTTTFYASLSDKSTKYVFKAVACTRFGKQGRRVSVLKTQLSFALSLCCSLSFYMCPMVRYYHGPCHAFVCSALLHPTRPEPPPSVNSARDSFF